MKTSLPALFVLLPVLLLSSACDAHQEGSAPRTLSTSGNGEVKTEPDRAVVRMQATATFKSGAAAKKEVDRQVNNLLAEIEKMGLDKDAVVASSLRIAPNFDYREGQRHFSGYTASRDVTVTLDDLDRLNQLLDTALSADIKQIGHIGLETSEEETLRLKARERAIADSKAKAAALAEAYGAELGPISAINYQEGQVHYPMARESGNVMRMAADGGGQGQYLHDEITFTDSIQVVFELIVPR